MKKWTKEQKNIFSEIMDKRQVECLNGSRTFKVSDYIAESKFGIINETLHNANGTTLEHGENGLIKVQVIFFGSGVMSHPTRTAWINEGDIEVPFPWLRYYWYNLINIFKNTPIPVIFKEGDKIRITRTLEKHTLFVVGTEATIFNIFYDMFVLIKDENGEMASASVDKIELIN